MCQPSEEYVRLDLQNDTTFVDFKHEELCRACDEPIDYEHVYHSEIFTTPDDRVFHHDCWTAWVLDGNEL